jgi:hypothetical protein
LSYTEADISRLVDGTLVHAPLPEWSPIVPTVDLSNATVPRIARRGAMAAGLAEFGP